MAAKPLVLPEPFSGETSWEEWNFHFSNVADVNEWDDEQKLKWLRVRLTGRAQMVFQRLPAEARASYAEATSALMERFEPKSRKIRFQVEFQTRRKKKIEGWADFADDLKTLVDKAFPDLQQEAREHLALQSYLQQLEQPQVAFGVRQKRPTTLDEAVSLTLEMETYMLSPTRASTTISTVEQNEPPEESTAVASVDQTAKLAGLLERLVTRVEKLEQHRTSSGTFSQSISQLPRCMSTFRGQSWRCHKPGHMARDSPQSQRSPSGNY